VSDNLTKTLSAPVAYRRQAAESAAALDANGQFFPINRRRPTKRSFFRRLEIFPCDHFSCSATFLSNFFTDYRMTKLPFCLGKR
jgi:hypothetical protein